MNFKKLQIRRVHGVPDLHLALFDGEAMIEGLHEVTVRSRAGELTKVEVTFYLRGLEDRLADEPLSYGSKWPS